MSGFPRDLRVAFRLLIRTPSATCAMLLSLAIGVGACTTVFSWINAILLQPFPAVAASGKYMVLASRTPSGTLEPLSYPSFRDVREAAPVFDNLVAVGVTLNALNFGATAEGDLARRVFANFVSGNYFDALGVRTEIGRPFRQDEDRAAGRDPVVLISHGFWQRQFGGDADVIGRTIHLNGHGCTIVGVADRRFIGTLVGLSVDLWVPIMMQPRLLAGATTLEDRRSRWILGLGRVDPDLSRAEIDGRLQQVSAQLAMRYPETDERRAVLIPIWRSPWGAQGGTGPVLAMFAGVVGFLLLLSCANAANLLLVRAIARRREIAVRLAIGATRAQIVRQLLIESLLLALVAGAAGLVVTYASSDLFLFFLPPTDSPFVFGRGVDLTVAAFAFGLVILTVMLFGVAPALRASRPDVVTVLKTEDGTIAAASSRVHRALVVIQVASCVILLTGAGLFLRSLQHARGASPGFSPDDVWLATYDLSQLGYDAQRGSVFHRQLLTQAAGLPGIETASVAARVPLGFGPLPSTKVTIDGYVPAPGEDVIIGTNVVGPHYFRTLRIPLLRGREFAELDASDSEPVAIVTEAMATRYWRTEDVVGLSVRIGEQSVRVVGVVADSKYRSLTEEPVPHLYLPASQHYQPRMTLHLRTSEATGVLPVLRAEARRLNPSLVLSNVQDFRTHMGFATLVPRVSASLLGGFGILALVVASLGVYSVVTFVISARRRELGIRLAVGASPRSIRILVIRHGLQLAIGGLVLGLLLAGLLSRSIATLLVGVSPLDPLTFGGVVLVLVGVAVVASAVPALRAGRLDTMRTLRS